MGVLIKGVSKNEGRDLGPLLNVHIIDYSNKITGYTHEAQQVKNRFIV